MSDAPPLDGASFAHWIGKTSGGEDVVTARLVREYAATLGPYLAPLEDPVGLFWCLDPPALPQTELGGDGHPRLGLLLPDVPFERRMWAGGEISFHGTVSLGDRVDKTSTIEDIAFKSGRSGALCFVTVRHHYRVDGRLIVDERQDIVYRDAAGTGQAATPTPAASWGEGTHRSSVDAGPTMLFRYSALTFNGHRIHYDRPYATTVEGYDGLVVHGPLQATLILNLAATHLGRLPSRFRYRGLSPLTLGDPFMVEVAAPDAEAGTAEWKGRVLSADGRETFSAIIAP